MQKTKQKTSRQRDTEEVMNLINNERSHFKSNMSNAKTTKEILDTRKCTCYTLFGKHDTLENDLPLLTKGDPENNKLSFAKCVLINDEERFFIKSDSSGRLFNPLGIEEGNHNKFLHHAGKDKFTFIRVNRTVFNYYLSFLKTKNAMYLNNAERLVY